ncbi:MAG: GtrA family protein [Rhizobiales bacterium]|nr:GtrA family protein [Hyphomicrobiales bacterium]
MNRAAGADPLVRRLAGLYLSGQFGRFLVAGGFAAIANFARRFVFEPVTGFWAAVALAYLVGFLTAFYLNRRFVFPASGKPLHREMAWFFLFNALAFPVVVLAAIGFERYVFSPILPVGIARAAAHGCAILLPVFANFLAHRSITFRASSG